MKTTRPKYIEGFREGQKVEIVDSGTAPAWNGQTGTVKDASPKYPGRVGVQAYIDRRLYTVYFHPSEIRKVE